MKYSLKNLILIFLTGIFLLSACTKEEPVYTKVATTNQPPVQVTPSTPSNLSNPPIRYELLFNDLIWAYDNDGAANLYLAIENKPDIFGPNSTLAQVWIRPESDSTWINLEYFHYPNSSEYVFSVYSNGLYIFHNPHIFPWSPDTHLAGTKASLKLRFL
jgi:hypothetical protein